MQTQSGSLLDSNMRNWTRLNSVLVFGISLLAIIGWFTGNQTLTQINSHWASMKFNTALCFALEAIAVWIGTFSFPTSRKIRIGVGFFVFLVALLTLAETAFGIKGGIDQLFVKDFILIKTSSPGRMSMITVICHLLIGVILVGELQLLPLWVRRIRPFLPPIVLSLSASALMGYAFGIEQAYGWGQMTRIAFHSALCLFLLALAFIGTPIEKRQHTIKERWHLAPYLAGAWFLIALVTITLIMHAKQSVTTQVLQEGTWIQSMAQKGFRNTEKAMLRLEARENQNTKNGFKPDTLDIQNYFKDFPELIWITVQSKRFNRPMQAMLTSPVPMEALFENQSRDFGFGIDLRCFFPNSLDLMENTKPIRFASAEFFLEPTSITQTAFPFANRTAIVDLSSAAYIRNTMNHRAYFVITITGLLLAAFTWFALNLSAKAEAKANEAFTANLQLGEFTKDLERSNSDLEQFVFIASHDLQTPLRHISGFVKLLLENPEIQKDIQSREYGRFIAEAVDRMQKLITGVLELSRVEKVPQAAQSIDLGDLFARNIRNLEPDLNAVDGKVEVLPGLPVIKGNAIRLSQLFDNLLMNSIKYRNKSKPLLVRISAHQAKQKWIVKIEDNGLGIKPEYREKVFQMFQRLHNQSDIKGTGIGLSLCRRIVEQHRGQIKMEDSSLGGVAVYIEFPSEVIQSNSIKDIQKEVFHAV